MMLTILQRWLVLVAVLIGAYWAGLWQGKAWEQAQQQVHHLEQTTRVIRIMERQQTISGAVATRHEQGRARDRAIQKTIEREVIRYVQLPGSDDCRVARDWLRLHTAAVLSESPDAPRVADATASDATTGDILATDTANYAACHETFRQLVDLQAWAHDQALSMSD